MNLLSRWRSCALTSGLLLCAAAASVAAPPAQGSFSLVLGDERALVPQGGSAVLRARVVRSGGFAGAVQLSLAGLPAGVSAAPVQVPMGATEAVLQLNAAADAPHSLPTGGRIEGRAVDAGNPQRATQSVTVTVRGPAGSVDTSFAAGAHLLPVGAREDYAHAIAVQPDGKVLVAGSSTAVQGVQLSVIRLLPDGQRDPGFGVDGKVILAVGEREDVARAIAVQADGRIVVAGLSHQRKADYDFLLLRLMPDGRLDESFGQQGRVLTDFGGDSDRAFAVLLMPDGRIVAAGQSNVNRATSGVDFAFARYQRDGTLDAAFGDGGRQVVAMLPRSTGDRVHGLALQTVDGQARLLAVGGDGDFTIARLLENGQLDAGFAQNGKATGLFNTSIGAAHAVTVLPTGEAVVAGHVGHDFAAVRLTLTGQLDPRFGPAGDGRFRHAVAASNWDEATALVRQADGRLLLGGWAYSGTGTAGDFAVLRLTEDGRLDAGFGAQGLLVHAAAGTLTDMGRAMCLQADDRVPTVRALLAGEAQGTNRDFALMRVWL